MTIEERLIGIARRNVTITPEWWDRNCRCCMSQRALFARRAMKGGESVITLCDELIHAWHTDAELTRFILVAELMAGRSDELKAGR